MKTAPLQRQVDKTHMATDGLALHSGSGSNAYLVDSLLVGRSRSKRPASSMPV